MAFKGGLGGRIDMLERVAPIQLRHKTDPDTFRIFDACADC